MRGQEEEEKEEKGREGNRKRGRVKLVSFISRKAYQKAEIGRDLYVLS